MGVGGAFAFARTKDPDPGLGFTYQSLDLMVDDFVTGPASWSGTGGAQVGAFTVAGAVPPDFTTTPDVLTAAGVTAAAGRDVTLAFDAPAPAGVRTILLVSWDEGTGNTVSAQVQIACRAPDGAASATLPAAELAAVPKGSAVSLIAIRASVADFTAQGVKLGRAVFGKQRAGTLTLN
jgi:hypothetical protein